MKDFEFAIETENKYASNDNRLCKMAFTLAEVLITLGIIGVVAALTMPTLIQNHKRQENITRIKKVYSILQQDVELAKVENGDIETLAKSQSIYKCLSCFACVDRCPRGVEPAKLVEALRQSVIREKGANHMTANDIPDLLDDEIPQQAIMSALRKYSK